MTEPIKQIVTHPGGAHKDDFLACSLLLATHVVPVCRREPTEEDLEDPLVAAVDVGHRHEPELMNFDHHQFPADAPPTCALSLVLMHLGLYEDARRFCDWLEPAEWFDCRGANGTAKWLGVDREIVGKLSSPIDIAMLRRFAAVESLQEGDLLWELMREIGSDLLNYLTSLRERIRFIGANASVWEIGSQQVLFLPKTDPPTEDPSFGIGQYVEDSGLAKEIVGLVYPDRRGDGYGLTRYNDHTSLNFTRIEAEPDVRFAHRNGFVAKTSAIEPERLRELVQLSLVADRFD